MQSNLRRRPRETDPVVAARLQAISYADPYVFVHASDVLGADTVDELMDEVAGGWVPPPAPTIPRGPTIPPPPVAPVAAPGRPAWFDLMASRLEPARSGVAALVVLGLVAAAVAGVVLLRAQASPGAVPLHPSTAASAGVAVVSHLPSPAPSLLVDVTGKVHRPGVVRLRNGARVLDAVRAAGGPLSGTSLDSLNLAAKVTDGQQVAVGAPAAAQPAADGGGSADGGGASSPVDLNTATVQQLQTLSGIGPVLAQRIIDYRTAHGPFSSVDGLQQVGGIGPAKFAEIKDHVTA